MKPPLGHLMIHSLSPFFLFPPTSAAEMSRQDDHLAYGHYYESERAAPGQGSRGLGDTFKKLRDTYKSHTSSHPPAQSYSQPGYQGV